MACLSNTSVKRRCMIGLFALGNRKPKLACSGNVMGSSFVLFYVSMEISLGKLSSGNYGHTSRKEFPVGKGPKPTGKGLCVTTAIVR